MTIKDKNAVIHLKTFNIRDFIKHFEFVETWLRENDKDTDIKFVIFTQVNEVSNFCVYDIEKKTHRMISELRENFISSVVGFEMGDDKDILFKKLVN